MNKETWVDIMSGISASKPTDLDRVFLTVPDAPEEKGKARAGSIDRLNHFPPSRLLWGKKDKGLSYIGIRVTEPCSDCAQTAFRLAAVAIERDVIPILITTLSNSGFEPFGFRTERLLSETAEEQAAQEEEIVAYWDLAVVVNISDIALIG